VDEWKLEPARDLGLTGLERCRCPWREGGLLESALRLGWWASLRGALRVWNRLTVHGRENLPARPPFVLVANHASHLDALVLGSLVPLRWRDQLFPLAAKDVFFETLPAAGFAAGVLNALPVWRRAPRGRGLAELRKRLLAEPCVYVLFPEGTRSRDGVMGAFKPGVGTLVAGTGVPVVPCHLRGTFEALPPGAWLPRAGRITVRLGTPLTFEGVADGRAGWEQVAGALEEAVRGLAAWGERVEVPPARG
jgi:1-acyl-sn-glycerol-3-phosphate acyltransferase